MAVAVVAIGVLSSLLAAAVDVEGDSVCPRPREVAEALAPLMGANDEVADHDLAEVIVEGTSVRLRLRRARDGATEERALPDAPSCGDRARTAAVILAAWEARLGSATSRPPVVASLPRLADSGEVAVAQAVPAVDLSRSWSAGMILSMNTRGAAVGGVGELSMGRPDAHIGAGIGVLLVDSHGIDSGVGRVTWWRIGTTVDGRWRFSIPRSFLQRAWAEARVGVALTAIHISGGLADETWFDPGVTSGLRLGLLARAPWLWLQLSAAYWPRPQILYTTVGTGLAVGAPPELVSQLPHFDVLAGLGLSFGSGR